MSWTGFITKGFIFGIIVFILFSIWGGGGGFKVAWDIGAFMKKVPIWAWVGLSVIILFKMMVGGRK